MAYIFSRHTYSWRSKNSSSVIWVWYNFRPLKVNFGAFSSVSKCTLSLGSRSQPPELQKLIWEVKLLHFERSVFIVSYYCVHLGTLQVPRQDRRCLTSVCLSDLHISLSKVKLWANSKYSLQFYEDSPSVSQNPVKLTHKPRCKTNDAFLPAIV